MLALPLLNSKLLQEPQIIYENEQKKIDWFDSLFYYYFLFILLFCFV